MSYKKIGQFMHYTVFWNGNENAPRFWAGCYQDVTIHALVRGAETLLASHDSDAHGGPSCDLGPKGGNRWIKASMQLLDAYNLRTAINAEKNRGAKALQKELRGLDQ